MVAVYTTSLPQIITFTSYLLLILNNKVLPTMEPKSNRYAHNVILKQSWVDELVYGNYNVKISFYQGYKA